MNKNKHNQQDSIPPSTYKFYLGSRQRYIYISSDFESGNIQVIRQLTQFNYRLNCLDDGIKTQNKVNSKSWFYFSVHGFPKSTKGKFTVTRVQTIISVYYHAPKSYRPVYRQRFLPSEEWSDWYRIPTQSPLVLRQTGELQCTFDFLFKKEDHQVQFAFAYPYTYTQNIKYLNSLNEYYYHDDFYFHKEVLIQSPEKRDIHLLTITSHDQPCTEYQEEELFNTEMFPEKCRPKRFKKPVVLISARVHPGETAASFAMEGVINFLINNKDLRSYLLKKMFVFMIVPMINVDGVYHGHFRMDGYGKNLNRYYIDPSRQKQPAVYAIRQLADHLIKSNRLSFYFDLHAHNAKKGAFIYGNAINDFVQQVQSQVFCKLFSLNHSGFQYEYCNFSQKQMNSKDRNEQRTKQGCGRVVMHRIANIIHSYSLECGIICPIKHNNVLSPMNSDFKLSDRKLVQEPSKPYEFFTIQSYRQLGKAMLVSILDVFDKNPYNRVYGSQHKSMQYLRRVTAFEVFHTADRFRMFEKYVYGKVKNINELIRQVLNSKLHYRQLYNFYFYNDKELKNTQWPSNIPGLVKPKFTQKLRRFKSLQSPKGEYSQSFIQDLQTTKHELQQMQSKTQQKPVPIAQQQENDSKSSQTQNEDEEIQRQNDFYQDLISQKQVHSQMFIPHRQEMRYEATTDFDISSWNTNTQPEPWLHQDRQLGKSARQEQPQQPIEDQKLRLLNVDDIQHHNHPQLYIFQKDQDYDIQNLKISPNDSPSMRVRRFKNEGVKKLKSTTHEIKGRLSELIQNSSQITQNSFKGGVIKMKNSSNLSNAINKQKDNQILYHDKQMRLFEQIKSQIKQQLKRHKQQKHQGMNNITIKNKNKSIKYTLSEHRDKDKERIKSTNLNFVNLNMNAQPKLRAESLQRSPSKSSIAKTQLPALNSHILIISSNSSKGLSHN